MECGLFRGITDINCTCLPTGYFDYTMVARGQGRAGQGSHTRRRRDAEHRLHRSLPREWIQPALEECLIGEVCKVGDIAVSLRLRGTTAFNYSISLCNPLDLPSQNILFQSFLTYFLLPIRIDFEWYSITYLISPFLKFGLAGAEY